MYAFSKKASRSGQRGFTLFEMIITLTVLSVLVLGTVPIAQRAIQRQREIRLRETLRQIRNAIDEFKRDTVGACMPGAITTGDPSRPGQGANVAPDPRSRVVIDDCTIFDTENLDRFPPSLETLVEGVRVKQRGMNLQGGSGIRDGTRQATEINSTEEVTKVYLREMPVDPMTGRSDWRLRSSYQSGDDGSWDSINVFDVRSASDAEAMNGQKYSEW
ncbi:MAG: type II secretion system protein [Acidobacteria bacterium]|nr:type II secretion system protein [Acidobacteriota bacterium]